MEDIHSQGNGRSPSSNGSRKAHNGGRRSPEGTKRNGRAKAPPLEEQLEHLLAALRAARRGDFSVRLTNGAQASVDGQGLMAEIAREFNAVVALNEAFAGQMVRVERVVGREGRMNERAIAGRAERRLGGQHRLDQRAHRRFGSADDGGGAGHQRGRRRRLHPEDGAGDRGSAGQRGVPAHRDDRQRHGRSAVVVRRRGHPRRQGGRHRRQAGRPGGGPRGRRDLARSDRQREPAGQQPDRAGAQHRRGDDGRRARKPVEEDHRRRQGGGAGAQEHHQHHGRSAEQLLGRGGPRGARGRHRGEAGRPGRRQGGQRRLEGPRPTTSTSWPPT